MNVIVGYGANAHLGLLHGMNKLIPALRADRDANRLHAIKDSVFWFNLLLGGAAACLAFSASYWVSDTYSTALRIVSSIVFVQMIFTYLFCLLRAESRFRLVSAGMALFAGLSAALVIIFGYLHPEPLYGALWGLFGANVLSIAFWVIAADYKFRFRIEMPEIRESFYLGIPLIVLGIIDMCFLSVDRWIIAAKFGPKDLGYYAIAIMLVNILGLAANSLSNVLFPHMVEKYAATQSASGMDKVLLLPLNAVAAAMPLVILGAIIILPLFITTLLPKYIPSIPLLDIMLPAAFFSSISAIAGTYLISINRQGSLIKIQLVSMAVAASLDFAFVALGFGAKGVAYGTFIGYFVSGLGYTGIAVYCSTLTLSRTLSVITEIMLPFVVMVVGLLLIGTLLPVWYSKAGVMQIAGLKAILVGLPLLGVIWRIHRRSELVGSIASEFALSRGNKI